MEPGPQCIGAPQVFVFQKSLRGMEDSCCCRGLGNSNSFLKLGSGLLILDHPDFYFFKGDWRLLHLLAHNMNPIVFGEFVAELDTQVSVVHVCLHVFAFHSASQDLLIALFVLFVCFSECPPLANSTIFESHPY